jgi:hypothetical protein
MVTMNKFLTLAFCLFAFSVSAQEIKTKVQESRFDVKPDPQKEEQFDEARIFIFLDAGYARRTGDVITGFKATNSQNQNMVLKFQTTDEDAPFKDGLVVNFGFRYFLKNNIGLGLRGNWFHNSADFREKSFFSNPADASTNIYSLMPEISYRKYFSDEDKAGFLYGCLGLGFSYQLQQQNYRFDRITNINQGFFAARPSLGVNVPLFDLFHFHSEVAYQFSQGKISDGTLSLSQFQISAGLSIRLNAF